MRIWFFYYNPRKLSHQTYASLYPNISPLIFKVINAKHTLLIQYVQIVQNFWKHSVMHLK